MVGSFKTTTGVLVENTFPEKRIQIYPDDKPWFNERLRSLKRERQRLSVILSVRQSHCMSVTLYVIHSVCLSVRLFVSHSVCHSVCHCLYLTRSAILSLLVTLSVSVRHPGCYIICVSSADQVLAKIRLNTALFKVNLSLFWFPFGLF